MSPELNGNQQPVLPKRNKKGRERKHASTSNIRHSVGQFSMPAACNMPNIQPYSYCTYPSAPGFPMHPEPMSLPIFPPSYHYGSPPVYNGFGKSRTFAPQRPAFVNDECVSLPVVIDDVDEEEAARRRFSDPGVPHESDLSSEGESRMLHVLSHQVNVLQESNRQLMREVTELRMELSVLKQQQQMHHANGFDRDYEPGMISDFIKEIRDAARIREDALLAKVKHIVEEKQFADNQIQLSTEKTRHNDRISKLEEQMKLMNVTTSNLSSVRSEEISLPSTSVSLLSSEESVQANRQVCELEREVLQLRREVQDSRAKKEESDNKILQLEKRLALLHPHMLQRRESVTSDDKASNSSMSTSTTMDNLSLVTSSQQSTTSITTASPMHHKFLQVGPVTDL